MSKVIWSSTSTMDYLLDLDSDELREVLIDDFGYDTEMIDALEDNELEDVIYDDSEMFDNLDVEEWEQSILPELESQTRDGIVIELHLDGRRGMGGNVELLDDMMQVNYDARFELVLDNGNLSMSEYSHDAPTGTNWDMYTFPSDVDKFVEVCMDDAIQDKLALYEDDEEYTTQDAIDEVILDLEDDPIGNIESYCNFSKVPEVCEPFKWTYGANESVEESLTVNNPSKLEMECSDVLGRYHTYGTDSFYAVPYESFKRSYPEFTKSIVEKYLNEDYGIDVKKENSDEINEEWQNGELITNDDWIKIFNSIKK